MIKRVPHTYVIIFYIIVICSVLTWILPGGEFDRETVVVNGVQREIVASNSFHTTTQMPQTWQLFSAFFKGFTNTADIIAFILMIGGAFWVMNDSKAIDIGIYSFLKSAHKLEKWSLINKIGIENIIMILIMLLFSIFGSVFGMSEETIAFTTIFVPFAISMGYDSIIGVSLCFVAAAMGFAGATLNPFTIGIAQGLSDLPLFSGIEYRFVCWIIINIAGIAYILHYAHRIKKNPQQSFVYEEDTTWRSKMAKDTTISINQALPQTWITLVFIGISLILFSCFHPVSELKIGNTTLAAPIIPVCSAIFIFSSVLTIRKGIHLYIINLLIFTIVFLIIGVMAYGWYIMEIASLFLALGFASGIAMGKRANELTQLFIEGAKDILPAAMVVGLAGGVIAILKDGHIIDTILHYMANLMNDFGKFSSIAIMYLIQTTINIFIPSGSGQAALTIPLMSQFSDLIGISRQTTVMVFQFGDGFTNIITPTSGVLIGVLGVAKIPYNKWIRWVTPLIIIFIILGFLLLIPTITMKLNGF